LTDAHADRSEEEQVTTSKFLNHVETWKCGYNIDRVSDNCGDEGVGEASILEVLSSVVDYHTVSCNPWIGFCRQLDLQMKLTPVNCCRDWSKHPVKSLLPRVPLKQSAYDDLPKDSSYMWFDCTSLSSSMMAGWSMGRRRSFPRLFAASSYLSILIRYLGVSGRRNRL
jgi:hypothetical protein